MENGDEKRSFKIAEGSASTTLKIFAQQAEVNIIFENNSFESVITHAVEGEMEAGNALHQMLENTGLSYFCDERSRSYAISWDEVNHPSSNNSNSVGNTHSKKQESKRIIR